MTYSYTIYGLKFNSSIDFSELAFRLKTEQSRKPEIEITEGKSNVEFDGTVTSGPFFRASQTDCILNTPYGIQYWIHQGKKIVISRSASVSNDIVGHFLIYGALPILLIQRGIFVLHGSAISDGQQAIILLGNSRSGKSTLTAGFWQRGWYLVSDELVVCTLDSARKVFVQPGIPQILLWKDSLKNLNIDPCFVTPARTPNQFLLNAGEKFETNKMPVQIVLCLERSIDKDNYIDVTGKTKFFQILQKIFLPRFPRPQVSDMIQVQIPLLLAASAPLKTVFWTSQQYTVSDLLDKILEQIK